MIFSLKTNFEPEATFNVYEAINSSLNMENDCNERRKTSFPNSSSMSSSCHPHPMTTGGTERVVIKNEVLGIQNL